MIRCQSDILSYSVAKIERYTSYHRMCDMCWTTEWQNNKQSWKNISFSVEYLVAKFSWESYDKLWNYASRTKTWRFKNLYAVHASECRNASELCSFNPRNIFIQETNIQANGNQATLSNGIKISVCSDKISILYVMNEKFYDIFNINVAAAAAVVSVHYKIMMVILKWNITL